MLPCVDDINNCPTLSGAVPQHIYSSCLGIDLHLASLLAYRRHALNVSSLQETNAAF